MNKEIIYLDECTVGVSDENGNIKKRVNDNNIEEILAEENKIESIKEPINLLKQIIEVRKIDDKNASLYLKLQPVAVIALIIIDLIIGAKLSYILLSSVLFIGICSTILGVFKKINKKKLNGYEAELKLAEEYLHEYEEELKQSLLESKSLDNEVLSKSNLNEIIPIAYSDGLDDFIEEELEQAYKDGYKYKEKTLTRTRKRK